ncbi:hypothetical protein NGB36_18305 [Streptomyces sp. RB6PN25]|uniref:Secreted protein n=1 Tax=Streptomyces humicola TaxID=2953240 RepID=A0ABT1PXU0_9ACTN|nr:hypothetical protein [Streptomyces humicola]MCQ4082500.1 hypothetical protein [Streptomyces humicola]
MPSIRTRPTARALMRSAVALSAAGAALAAGAGAAAANGKPSHDAAGPVAAGPVGELSPAIAPITHLQLNPLGRTPVDPTTNGVGIQLADFKPIATTDLTKPLSDGDSISQLPYVGEATRALVG